MKKQLKLVERAKKLSSSELLGLLNQSNFLKNYEVKVSYGNEFSNEYRQKITDLFEINMKTLYEQSNDGYDYDEKQEELFSVESRYLLILSSNDIIAYAHFRFDMDYGSHVIYLYELQVDKSYQGQGLGQFIIEQIKELCRKTKMLKIVLTVHKVNQKAIDFYMKKCLFQVDITDPSDEPVDYVILSFII